MDHVGEAVAAERKLAGLTQEQLAQRAHVSSSLVKAVEQGRAPASPAFISSAARALGVGVAELQGLPLAPRTPDDHRTHAVIPALRAEMAAYRLDSGVEPRALAEIRAEVDEISRRRQAADLLYMGEVLPGVLSELRAVVARQPSSGEAFALMSLAYAAAGQVAYKMGYSDLAAQTTDRVEWAAARSGSQIAGAAGDFYRAGELIATSEWVAARTFLDAAQERLGADLSDEALRSMSGQLHLKSALAAARQGDASATDDHLAEAERLAAGVGEFRNDYDLSFNRHNVAIWSVGLAVELLDGGTAVERAARVVNPVGVSPERIGHHFIDLARGYLLKGDKNGSFQSLLDARRVSPQQTRYHPQVRETARILAQMERRRSDSLASFASWLGDRPAP